jgi:hypothetical protein
MAGTQEINKWAGIAAVAGGVSGYSNDTDLAFYVGCFILAANCTCPPVEKMRIQSSTGNVGIGTTSPNFKTHISTGDTTNITQPTAGTYGLYIQQNTSGNVGGLYIQDGASNSGNAIFVGDNNGAARFVVNNDGQIGIGTTDPNIYSLSFTKQVTISNTSSSQYANLTVAGGSGASGGIDFGNQSVRHAGVYGLDGSNLGFYTNGTNSGNGLSERMRISSLGRVGIGLTSPTAFLHVCGNNCGADISCGGGNPDARGIIHAQLSNSSQSSNASVTVENDAGIGQFMQWTSFGMRIGSRIIKSTNCGHLHFTVGQDSNTVTFHCGGQACFANHICVGGNIVPISNGSQDLGSSSLRWCTVYTSDLSLNNGIGNYTIVEGESDLFLYNNNSCKVFKFLLQEVCPEIAPAKRST